MPGRTLIPERINRMPGDEHPRPSPLLPTSGQMDAAVANEATHPQEPHGGAMAGRLNWLRPAVLGADDGIVSVAGIVVGVAGATSSRDAIFTVSGYMPELNVLCAIGDYSEQSEQPLTKHILVEVTPGSSSVTSSPKRNYAPD